MNAEKCKILLETLDCGSISAAAKVLGYTASGISKTVSSLEEEVGFPLVQRSRDGVRATQECELMLPLFRELVSVMNKIDQTAASIQGLDIGTLSVGCSYDIYYRWLTEKIAEFFQSHPGVRVQAYNEVSSKLRNMLQDHKIDAAIMSRRSGDFEWIHLQWDRMVALVPKNHPLVKTGRFPLKQIIQEDYIDIYPGDETDNSLMLERNHITTKTRFSCADGQAAVPLVEKGLGVCIVNQIIADGLTGDIEQLPLYPEQLVDIGIALPNMEATSPVVRSFIHFLQENAESIVG